MVYGRYQPSENKMTPLETGGRCLPRCRAGGVLMLATLLLLSCPGADLDDLTRRLRCGMSVDEVRSLARVSGAQFYADPRIPVLYGTHRTARGRARVYLGFDRDRLTWFRDGEQRGLTGMLVGVKHDLCTGRMFGSLVISAKDRWERAAILLDGRPIATLPPAPNVFLEIDVPAGNHRLVIAKPRSQSFTQEISIGEDADGVVRVDVE